MCNRTDVNGIKTLVQIAVFTITVNVNNRKDV